MTQREKTDELYAKLKPICEKEGKNLFWEMEKELKKFRREHPDLDMEWAMAAYE